MMKREVCICSLLLLVLGLFCCGVFAQAAPDNSSAADAAAAAGAAGAGAATAGCMGCGLVAFIFVGGVIALDIAILVWVARDAKSRGLDNGILWMLLVFFTSFIGLIIYLLARPQGNLIQCPHCNNKRMQVSKTCPHCGNE